MDLKELQLAFMEDASKLGDYASMTKTELANGYCDADEALVTAATEYERMHLKSLRSAYFAALMVRYWYKIFKWIKDSSSLRLDPTEFVNWLSHSLYVAFYYRKWRYEYKAVVKEGVFISWKYDENGERIPNNLFYERDIDAPDKCINICCESMRGRVYQYYNKDKRKLQVHNYSLDEELENFGDSAFAFEGTYSDAPELSDISGLIAHLIAEDKPIQALIVDNIVHTDCFVRKKDAQGRMCQMFSRKKLVKNINELTEQAVAEFCRVNKMSEERVAAFIERLKAMPNYLLNTQVKRTIENLSNNPELLGYLTAAGGVYS